MYEPRIAFCTTVKGRVQHIERTLPKNLEDNARYKNAVFVILDYNSQDNLVSYLNVNHRAAIESGRLAVYTFTEPGPFRMAHAKNMAHRLGILEGAEVLVNLDADNFTGIDFANHIADRFHADPRVFLWANRKQPEAVRFPKGCNGRIVVSTEAFVSAGGYDEKYSAWGPDDKDFHFRLRRLGYTACEINRQHLDVILHNDKMRFREYPEAEITSLNGEEQIDEDSDSTIANFGRFGCGQALRTFSQGSSAWVELRELPTRIFGIGMHKTGTTSLHAALRILKYDSAHWKSAHWAKDIWLEMMASGRSVTLERSYALSDMPLPLLYDRLDRAYPGSKFILTTRNEEGWLNSVRNHWNPEHNPFRSAWDTDPFTHRLHREIYGRKSFDAEVFVARYRRHNAEVKQYFKERPNDLLVLDLDQNIGWDDLCGFLKRPAPSTPYPRKFATSSS